MPQTVKALTGTIVNYFTHCKRQCWLFSNMLNMEDNSEDVRIGKVLHELKNRGKVELAIDSIKLDKITDEYVIEMKKSDSDIEAAKAQLTYYLFVLRNKGIYRKGRLVCIEKNEQEQSEHIIELSGLEIEQLQENYFKIEAFLQTSFPPVPELKTKCKKCAYYEYCFI